MALYSRRSNTQKVWRSNWAAATGALMAAIGLLSPASPCAQPASDAQWASVIAAAKKEAKVVLYAGMPVPVLSRLKGDFDKTHPGIALEYSRPGGGAVTIGKLDQERASGSDGADVVVSAATTLWFGERAKEGALKTLSGPAAKAWPAAYLLHPAFAVLGLEPFVMAYNTNQVKAPITGYRDLLKPEFKGKIGTTELVGSPSIVAWYEWLEKTQGPDFLPRFAAQAPRVYAGSAIASTQSTAAGEIMISAFSIPSATLPLIAQGAPLKMVIPDPSLGLAYVGAALGWAKRPNAALVLMDYLMSSRGQTTLHGQGEMASPLPGIAGSLDIRAVNAYDASKYPNAVVKEYAQKWDRLFRGK